MPEQFPAERAVSITSFFQHILENGPSVMGKKDLQSGIFDPCLRFVVSWHAVVPASNWPLPNITRGICTSIYHQENPVQGTSKLQQQSSGKAQRGPCSIVSSSTSLLCNSHQSYNSC